MFDAQQPEYAQLLDQLGRQYHKHLSAIVPVDCSAIGWAPNGSGSESGRFDYEGNGLLIVPTFMRASDLAISTGSSKSGHAVGANAAAIYVFMNTKDNPGLPMQIHSESGFGNFCAICCTFTRFYVYVSKLAILGATSQINLAVLKGLDLSGCGSNFRNSGAEIVGCYGGGAEANV